MRPRLWVVLRCRQTDSSGFSSGEYEGSTNSRCRPSVEVTNCFTSTAHDQEDRPLAVVAARHHRIPPMALNSAAANTPPPHPLLTHVGQILSLMEAGQPLKPRLSGLLSKPGRSVHKNASMQIFDVRHADKSHGDVQFISENL